jgi:hypothetical protein
MMNSFSFRSADTSPSHPRRFTFILAALVALAALLPALAGAADTGLTVSVDPSGGNVDLRTSIQVQTNESGVPVGDVATLTEALPPQFTNQLRSFGSCPQAQFANNEGPTASNCADRSAVIGTASLTVHSSAVGDATTDRAFIVKTSTNRLALWWHFTGSNGVETSGVVPATVGQETTTFGPTVTYDFTTLPAGLLVKQVSLNYLRSSSGVAPFSGNGCTGGSWTFQARITYEGGTSPQQANATAPCGTPVATPPQPSKLELARATIFRSSSLIDILAPITARASGYVSFDLHAAGEHHAWRSRIDAENGRVRTRHRIPAAQARLGTGILTMRYPGDADTRPQVVRLRAAANPAALDASRPVIQNGRLIASGTISRRAQGVVRLQLEYYSGGRTTTIEYRARISRSHWRVDTALPPEVQSAIAARQGAVHSYILFTGYLPARMRGEMQSFQVLP